MMKTKSQIINEMRNYFESSKEKSWDKVAKNLKPHGTVTVPAQKKFRYKLVALPVCLVFVGACVITAFAIINRSGYANDVIPNNNISSTGENSANSINGAYSSAPALTSAVGSTPAPLSSGSSVKNVTGSNVSTPAAKTVSPPQTKSSSSKATGASSSPRSSTAIIPRSDIIGGDATGGLFMPCEPQFLDYNHKLYMFSRDFTEPDNLIGYHKFNETSPDSYKVCSVKGTDVSKCICEQDSSNRKNGNKPIYWNYNYICDDTITVNGTVYDLTGGKDAKIIENGHSSPFSYAKFAVTSDHTFSLAQGTGGKGNEYYFFAYGDDVAKITDNVIGKLSTGTVYSIDEVNPSRLISLNLNGKWFVAEKKDDNGYNGKTITDILKDKGLYHNDVIN